MTTYIKNTVICLTIGILLTSCFEETIIPPDDLATEIVDFNFEISQNNIIDLSFKDADEQPIARIGIEVLTDLPENNGYALFTAFTDSNGDISTSINLPSNLNTLVLKINHTGTIKYFSVELENGIYQLHYYGVL
ncbi:hypothetical protein [Reichenbachiella sp. MALMAid0571]|uniref:hypothetical protein n=1 Tax=Reichenbachiella sp. MALMAid0571 TaxID=3143939 RepID=UPI0032DFD59B